MWAQLSRVRGTDVDHLHCGLGRAATGRPAPGRQEQALAVLAPGATQLVVIFGAFRF